MKHLSPARRAAIALTGRRSRRRWIHLLLGGALLIPFVFVTEVLLRTVGFHQTAHRLPVVLAAAFVLAIPLVAVAGLVPVIRPLEGAAARVLLGELTISSDRSWAARFRTALWFTLHLGLGGAVALMTAGGTPAAVALIASPGAVFPGMRWPVSIPLGVATAAVIAIVSVSCGALLARLAPALLGPSAAERIAELEHRAQRLADRNRFARDLHDSIGHALSIMTLQAGAAGRLVDTDAQFVRGALSVIEESAREAMTGLNHALGVLRDEAPGPQPDMNGLDALVAGTRAAGLDVTFSASGDVASLSTAVSREAYRIIQEGLTNALRHAGEPTARLRLAVEADHLKVEMTNPAGDSRSRRSGGRGLAGIAERAAMLGGSVESGPVQGQWRLLVRLPFRTA